jgi:hypothetical protein
MILISHRGNLNGKIENSENEPDYIRRALDAGFDCEIDVWYKDSSFYLGHDEPTHKIVVDFLKKPGLWCHAKNIEALNIMLTYRDIHCFWHQEDDVTLTSRGNMWTYPGKPLTENSICVLPEKNNEIPKKVLGICSDYIVNYRN